MQTYEVRGIRSEMEGRLLLLRDGARVYTLGVAEEHYEHLNEVLAQEPSPYWISSTRHFERPAHAEHFCDLVKACGETTPHDLPGLVLMRAVERGLTGVSETPLERPSTWSLKPPDFDTMTTTLQVGGRPRWYRARPNPLDPDTKHPMVCMAQFEGSLDPRLPGDQHTRFFVFGAGDYQGENGCYCVLWQHPADNRDRQYRFLEKPGTTEFAVVTIDLIQVNRPPVPESVNPYRKATMIWRGEPGTSGTVRCFPFRGDVDSVETEFITTVAGLMDEGFVESTPDLSTKGWLGDSLLQTFSASGRPVTVDHELYFDGVEHTLYRLCQGFSLRTTAKANTIEDEIVSRVYNAMGGVLESPGISIRGEGWLGEGPLMPILTFEEGGALDHPHVEYAESGLAYLMLPASEPKVQCGRVMTFDRAGTDWSGW